LKLQVLSDLHLETETCDPEPAPGAEALVLAGDIDSTWAGFSRFRGWPVPVLFVPGNHEYDGRELTVAEPALRAGVEALGMVWLERRSVVLTGADGRRIRFAGTVRWCDFDLFGADGRSRAMRAGTYFQKVMRATHHGAAFDAAAVRQEALACRAWLAEALAEPAAGRWDATVAVTHFAPSFRSADPRYGSQPGTASFCNADDDLLPRADLWLHGHLHCRHDYRVAHAGGGSTRVVCQARGLSAKGEDAGWLPQRLIAV
jgi:hypothetical protein